MSHHRGDRRYDRNRHRRVSLGPDFLELAPQSQTKNAELSSVGYEKSNNHHNPVPARRPRETSGGRSADSARSPCSFFSVSQNFCSSVKYLSRMNTLERPSVAMAGGAQASHSAAAPLSAHLRRPIARFADRLLAGWLEVLPPPAPRRPARPRPSASAYLQAVEPSTVSLVRSFRRANFCRRSTTITRVYLGTFQLLRNAARSEIWEQIAALPLKWRSGASCQLSYPSNYSEPYSFLVIPSSELYGNDISFCCRVGQKFRRCR